MIVGDDHDALGRCLASVRPLVGELSIVASGSVPRVLQVVVDRFAGSSEAIRPSWQVVPAPWTDFGTARTRALQLAGEGSAEWVLMLDADMTIAHHPELLAWLAADHFPRVNAWQVQVHEAGVRYWLPLLTRRRAGGRYVGRAHEYLEIAGGQAQLTGLTVFHHADGSHRAGKLERDLELLRADLDAGDPRATYYSAQAYRDLGDTQRAIALYRRRASLGGWDEEAWHAAYQAAKLARDLDGLIRAWRARPWRHEPLTAAAQLVRSSGLAERDRLFRED